MYSELREVLRRNARTSATVALSMVGVLLLMGGVVAAPFSALNTSHSEDAHGGPPEVTEQVDPDEEGEESKGLDESSEGEGPDDNASQTAKNVHEAQRLAGELGDDAPPCAHGKYVSAAATGAWDPVNDPDGAPAFEDMPCVGENGEDGESAEIEESDVEDTDSDDDDDDGPPAHAKAKGHAKQGGGDSED